MMTSKIWTMLSHSNRISKTRLRNLNMPPIQHNKCRRIYKKCTNLNNKENNKKLNMQDKFKGRRSREGNRDHQMPKIS